MRKIDLIVIHCSATRADRCYTEYDLITDHLRRGFSGAGYHYYIRKNGDIKSLRRLKNLVRMFADIMLTLLVCAMKVAWMGMAGLLIQEQICRNTLSVYW